MEALALMRALAARDEPLREGDVREERARYLDALEARRVDGDRAAWDALMRERLHDALSFYLDRIGPGDLPREPAPAG